MQIDSDNNFRQIRFGFFARSFYVLFISQNKQQMMVISTCLNISSKSYWIFVMTKSYQWHWDRLGGLTKNSTVSSLNLTRKKNTFIQQFYSQYYFRSFEIEKKNLEKCQFVTNRQNDEEEWHHQLRDIFYCMDFESSIIK